ncbi:MAG: FAD-dependent oxidoreductase, partial [Oscillospiraceae bacterium]|nr:FAD-dependent oxidoreductase [Oscillospiraceae bacterium]
GKVAVQLYHAGRYMPRKDVPCDKDALSPSATFTPYTRETAPEMSRQQILDLLEDYAQGARRAKEAGFDAVEISASSGYLLCQFLSPLTNLRTDEYGGSFENRCRFPLQVIGRVKEVLGNDIPLILRLGAEDFVPGSNTLEDSMTFAPLAEKAGVDMFNITGGWHETKVPQLTGDLPRGGLSYLGKGIRSVVSVPVMMCNRVHHPDTAELLLALERADLVGLGRPLVADPELPNKAKAGKPEEIRPCMACNQGCLANTFFDRPITCLVNGICGRELQYPLLKAETPKRVLVVGGGPAGCEMALRAAQRGHQITLMEASDRLGGQVRLGAILPARQEFETLIRFYEVNLPRRGVTVLTGKRATLEDCRGYDQVIVATGGIPNVTELPVSENSMAVYTARQVLKGDVVPGKRVVVIGGSYIGCFTAQYLARQGAMDGDNLFFSLTNNSDTMEHILDRLNNSDRSVTLVEQGKKIGLGFESGTSWPVLGDLNRLHVPFLKNTRVTAITDREVLAEVTEKDGTVTEKSFPADCVVVASGVHSGAPLAGELEQAGIPYVTIGNAHQLGKAIDAIRAGAELGLTI